MKKYTLTSFVSLLLVITLLISCAAGASNQSKGTQEVNSDSSSVTTSSEEAATVSTNASTGSKPNTNNPITTPVEKIVHPAAAPEAVPGHIIGLTSFSTINNQDYCPSSYNSSAGCYVEGYTGILNNRGRLHLTAGKLRIRKAHLLFKDLSLTSDSGSAFYISDPGLDINIFIDGSNTLSSNSSVTLNNNSGMNESTMNYNNCSSLRIMGVNDKNSDILSIVSSFNRSSIGGRLVVNNCTLDLSGGTLTSYANICIEQGGKVIFPNGSMISLSNELDYGIYFSCNYEKGHCTVYCTDENKTMNISIAYSTGESLELSGKSGRISLDMPAPGTALSMDNDFCSVTCTAGKTELMPNSANGNFEFYLPGGTDLKKIPLNIYLGEGYSAKINNVTYSESSNITVDVSKSSELDISFISPNGGIKTQHYKFVISSANVLYMNIDENLGTIGAMNGDSSHETYCYGSLSYIATDSKYDFTSYFSLKGRGNATWDDEKKGYALKLYNSDSYDEKNKIDISGMGKTSNWVLLANHRDRTLIRTALALTLAQKLGMAHAVDFVFVDLYMNGDYLGLYMLVEKIQTGNDQIDIEEAESDNLEGGYLLEFDNYDDTPQIKLKKSGQKVTVNAPDNLESYKAIEKLLNEAEEALTSSNGYNKTTRKYWYDYIDINSFAVLWMVREYAMDYDADVNFRFYYDPADGKFHGGPAWDFDNSMARTANVYANAEYALLENAPRNRSCWLTKLLNFEEFRNEIIRLYNENIELFTTSDSRSIYALANRYYDELAVSIDQNFKVWKNQLTYYNWNMPRVPTYDGHFEILTDFLETRNAFWRKYIPGLED